MEMLKTLYKKEVRRNNTSYTIYFCGLLIVKTRCYDNKCRLLGIPIATRKLKNNIIRTRLLGIQIAKKKVEFNENKEFMISVNVADLFWHYINCKKEKYLDVIICLLAIENYENKNNYGLVLYQKMKEITSTENTKDYIKEFFTILKDYKENNILEEKYLLVNRNLNLCGGLELLTLAFYYNVKTIKIKNINQIDPIFIDKEWLLSNVFEYNEVELILKKYEKIYFSPNNKVDISCVLWAPAYNYFEQIVKRIKFMASIKEMEDYKYADKTYNLMVSAIYHLDEIDKNLINEFKIGYMKPFYPKILRHMTLEIEKPIYKFNQNNMGICLKQGVDIKLMIRAYCKNIMSNYFYDITIHTADTSTQTEYINTLFKPKFSITNYLEQIKNYNYMVIKHDTDYMTKDFPKTVPFCTDMDIICSKECFNEIWKFTKNYFLNNFSKDYEVVEEKTIFGEKKVSLYLGGYLVYMIHICCNLEHFKDSFLEETLTRRIKSDTHYVSNIQDEICYRLVEFIKYPCKTQHFNYIIKNKNNINKELTIKNVIGAEEFFIQHTEVLN